MPQFSRKTLLAVAAILLASLVRTAWVSDDAYISFRTVDNILNGYGLVWNVAERVQAYTHPLWLMLCTAAVVATGDVYYTSIALGIALTLVSVWLLTSRLALTPQHLVVCVVALLSSKAWIDYSTSGLENPLTHVLVILFAIANLQVTSTRGLWRLSLVGGLLALNRLDLVLLAGPAIAFHSARLGLRVAWRPLALGFVPVLAWLLFATFYYGSPFPNTAYAKLTNAMTTAVRWERGADYLYRTLIADPVTLPVMAFAAMAAIRSGRPPEQAFTAGVLLYLLYIVSIGGDFMMGRFLTAPFVASIALLARAEWLQSAKVSRVLAGIIFLVGLGAAWEPAVFSGYGYAYAHRAIFGPEPWGTGDPPTIRVDRITDERLAYYEATGLLKVGMRGQPLHPWVAQGLELRSQPNRIVVLENVGLRGYYAGPRVHIIDSLGLGDPLLARLPGGNHDSVMGHFVRAVPAGYLESIAEGKNRVADPDLAAYYDRLRLVVAGPLWNADRIAAVASLLAGAHDDERRRFVDRSRNPGGARSNTIVPP